jgi:hypothetical protein
MTRTTEDGAALIAAGAGLLGLAVLADSGLEHYRGSFHNKAMVLPLVAASLAIGATALARRRDEPRAVERLCDAAQAVAIGTGAAGLAFHACNVGKRPGGWSWGNLFHAAPIGAPFALSLAGLLGRMAARPRRTSGRAIAAVAAVGIAGSAAEAALLHLRGAYQNPAMVLPVTIPPVAATLLGAAACAPRAGLVRAARGWLKVTAALGLVGSALHAYGISRRMGGWRNWSQNLLAGPPLPAPPAFTGLALAGLAALQRLDGACDE